jgi:6-phosphogluconolactonase
MTEKTEIFPDAASAARAAAVFIASESRAAIAVRGRFIAALSGGSTPWLMLRDLALENIRWDAVQLVQADERIAPDGDPDRNLTHLHESLLGHTSLRPEQIHPMPVKYRDLEAAAVQYAETITELSGTPPVLDLVHLGLGPDGHTASLLPGDPVLEVTDADVGLTGPYQGRRRMTLTYPILNRARRVLWLVTGAEKMPALRRLQAGDLSIPAGRVRQDRALIFADRTAAGETS